MTYTTYLNRQRRQLHASICSVHLFAWHGNSGTENIYNRCRTIHWWRHNIWLCVVFSSLTSSSSSFSSCRNSCTVVSWANSPSIFILPAVCMPVCIGWCQKHIMTKTAIFRNEKIVLYVSVSAIFLLHFKEVSNKKKWPYFQCHLVCLCVFRWLHIQHRSTPCRRCIAILL